VLHLLLDEQSDIKLSDQCKQTPTELIKGHNALGRLEANVYGFVFERYIHLSCLRSSGDSFKRCDE